jgi:hypothetical protein
MHAEGCDVNVLTMRTKLTINHRIAKVLKALARRSGKPFEQVVNETLQAGLGTSDTPAKARPYRVKPASLGSVLPGVDLTNAVQLVASLEDEKIVRRLQTRK